MGVVSITFPGNLTQVATADGLRGLPSFGLTNGQIAGVVELASEYSWDPASLTADDGQAVIKPNDTGPLQAGRWLLYSGTGTGGGGSGGAKAATLDELKAANVETSPVNLTAEGLEGIFYFTLADYTGQADDINIVKQDDTPLTTGAWVRQSAASISTKLPTTFSIPVTQQERNERDPVFVSDYVRTSTGDQTLAIERAVNDAVILGRPVSFDRSYSCQTIEVQSGMIFKQANPYAKLTILDDGTPASHRFLLDGVETVVFDGLTIDSTADSRTGVNGNITIMNSENIDVLRCDIGLASSNSIWTSHSKVLRFMFNKFHDNYADAVHMTRGTEDAIVAYNQFYGNHDDNCASIGYLDDGGIARGPNRNIWFIRNDIRNNVEHGSGCVFLGTHGGGTFQNRIDNTALNGITVSYDVGGATTATHYCQGLTLRDDIITNVGSSGVGRGYAIDTARRIRIINPNVNGSANECVGLFGAVIDCEIPDGSLSGNGPSNRVLNHQMTPTSAALAIQELATNFGEPGVTELVSRDLVIGADIRAPANGTSIRIIGVSGKPIRGVKVVSDHIEIHPGGANNGVELAYCEKPVVEAGQFTRYGSSGKSTGSAISLTACPKARVINGDNDQAAGTGVALVAGSSDFDIKGFRSENGVLGLYSDDNAAVGLYDQCWLRGNTSGAVQNFAGATPGTNITA